MMASEIEALDRCVSKFMTGTCRHGTNEYEAMVCMVRLSTKIVCSEMGRDGFGCEMINSGSAAEFYIKPMLSCIGDMDIMPVLNNMLAIPLGYIPPTQLPDHYQELVDVFEMVNSHQLGYVFFRFSYVSRKNKNGCYIAEKVEYSEEKTPFIPRRHMSYNLGQGLPNDISRRLYNQDIQSSESVMSLLMPDITVQGPARKAMYSKSVTDINAFKNLTFSSYDFVNCVHCPFWPPSASSWITRRRDHGWPNQTCINLIENYGVLVVAAVHPNWKQDQWANNHQWRLSFSRAEVLLLNSWTPIQQIIYHLLRFVIKHEVLSKSSDRDCDLHKLCNYHIKTLMMWECEQKPQNWWSAESSIVKRCSILLHKLSDWVENKQCEHYFIRNCNLFDHFVADDSLIICKSLKNLTNESVLLTWFVDNYILKCAQFCPDEISDLFKDICFNDQLERAVDALVDWKLNLLPLKLWMEQFNFEKGICVLLHLYRRDAVGTRFVMRELQNVDPKLLDYFVAMRSLRVAYMVSLHSLNEDFLEILWSVFAPGSIQAVNECASGALLSIRRAIKLANLEHDRSDALEMLHNEMSKAYLHQSLTYGQKSTFSLVHVLLAVLYYKSGQSSAASEHCKQVLIQDECYPDRLSNITVDFLPRIDERADAVFGLILLYQHFHQKALNLGTQQPQQESKPAVTLKLLAYYLYSQSSSPKESNLTKYRQRMMSRTKQLLPSDVLLFKLVETHKEKDSEIPAAEDVTYDEHDTELLVTTLELVALETLTSYRYMMVSEANCEQCPVLNEFQALHAYKCGLFDECLQICRDHINKLLRTNGSRNQSILTAMPEIRSLLDGELLSLFGVIVLSRPVVMLLLCECPESISLLTLLIYLMVQCQKKLRSDSLIYMPQLIRCVHNKVYPADRKYYLDRLILKLAYRSLKLQFNANSEH